jgi:hypothetical protein
MKRKKRMKDGEIIKTPPLSNSSKKEAFFQIYINRNLVNNKNKSKTSSNFHNNYSNKKPNNKNSYLTPKTKKYKNYVDSLNSIYNTSIKKTIINLKEFDLQQKKQKVLQAKELKNKTIKSKSEELEKKRKRIKIENIKEKILIEKSKKLKEKENSEKKKKIKDLKEENINRFEQTIKERNRHYKILIKNNKLIKMQILQDILDEKNKIKEEKQKKIDLIKQIDFDILKRKKDNEKYKKKIIIEQLKKEIKLQKEFNRKLSDKIIKLQDKGLGIIEKLI